MLGYAVTFFIIAIIAALFGFRRHRRAPDRVPFFIFVVLFLLRSSSG